MSINNSENNITKKVIQNFMLIPKNQLNCLILKNQECKARKVIIDNDCMTFPCKMKVDKCVGS